MSKAIYVQIDNEKIKAEGELLESVLQNQMQATDELNQAKARKEEEKAKRAEILVKLGITEAEARLLLS